MADLIWTSESEADTERLGRALAGGLFPGAVVALHGTLGVGKTRLVQAIAEAAGLDPHTTSSPTFTLVHEYDAPAAPIFHFDAYRLSGDAEFAGLGADDYLYGAGWSFVEWADRVPESLPAERLTIRIEPTGERSRRFALSASGEAYHALLAHVAQELGGSL
ncbi:MAG TPA: tRNA (adenosine(37)-N6)-threonylcarbamoyltransferase complex ATPase subunit type 1 TsaE [Pirellulales bacterium]